MAKTKTVFFCQNCGAQSAKWIGNCPSCGEWNTYVEEVIQKESKNAKTPAFVDTKESRKPRLINEIEINSENRVNTGNDELNRVLGGGMVPGSLVLIGGEPGIGKSTLMLQVALKMKSQKILYVTGEESSQQIKMRADRVKLSGDHFYVLTETSTQSIFSQVEKIEPDVLIIDPNPAYRFY